MTTPPTNYKINNTGLKDNRNKHANLQKYESSDKLEMFFHLSATVWSKGNGKEDTT